MQQFMQQMDRLLAITLHIQEKTDGLDERVGRLEQAHEKTYNKIDGFISFLQRNETETFALRGAYDRLSDRIDRLEKQTSK